MRPLRGPRDALDNPWRSRRRWRAEFAEPSERPANVVALEDVVLDEDGDG
jgi:hypothetical protein